MRIPTILEGGSSFKSICEVLIPRPRWIISDDFGLAQIVGEGLTLLTPGKDLALSLITPAYLSSHHGVSPQQIPDLLALSEGKHALMTRKQAAKFLQLYGGIT